MPGPRDYTAGTRAGLFAWAHGTCYFPGCKKPVVDVLEGIPVIEVDIVHIRGAKAGSARYDASMTDDERRAVGNLMLMCRGHHTIIDDHEDDYPVPLLHEWKATRESQTGIAAALAATGVDEVGLADLILSVIRDMGSIRRVEVDLEAAIRVGESEAITSPLELVPTALAANPHLQRGEVLVSADVRNVGGQPVSIASVDLHFGIRIAGALDLAYMTMARRNDLPVINPRLPVRVLDGAATRWSWNRTTVAIVLAAVASTGQTIETVHVEVRLESGERASSIHVPWSHFVDAGFAQP